MARARVGEDVSRGYSILGDSPVPPPGYTPHGRIVSNEVPLPRGILPLQERSSPSIGRQGAVVSAAGGRAILAGGYLTSVPSADVVEEYDPRADRWTITSRSTAQRYAAVAVTIGDSVHVLGGLDVGGNPLDLHDVLRPTSVFYVFRKD